MNPFAEALIGPGIYKLGYVTTDREQAIEVLSAELGIEEFVPFEPAFEAKRSDGQTGRARLRCAFSAGRDTLIEVLEPVDGLVDVFAEPLGGADGFAIAFHHVAVMTDDVESVKRAAAELGIRPELEGGIPDRMAFTYTRLPGLGHYVEHSQYIGDGDALITSVRGRTIA
jgi:hypothetical protein